MITSIPNRTPTLLLVHGAWHGPWAWSALVPALRAGGFRVATLQLPSVALADGSPRHGLHDDAAAVRQRLSTLGGDVVVVAHSYGGAVVSEAVAGRTDVRYIVYVAAFVLDIGESLLTLRGGSLPPWYALNGDTILPTTPRTTFYNDMSDAAAAEASALLLPTSLLSVTERTEAAAWRDVPSTYVVCDDDQALPPHVQLKLAARTGLIKHLPGGHSPFLSRPRALTTLLLDLARSW